MHACSITVFTSDLVNAAIQNFIYSFKACLMRNNDFPLTIDRLTYPCVTCSAGRDGMIKGWQISAGGALSR